MFTTNTTENKPISTFLYGEKRFKSFFDIFSCVNRFENYGNKSINILMNHFANTRGSKKWKYNKVIVN